MKLRIISGSLKGRTIAAPDKGLSFRPTLERTRQSIADIITPRCAAGGVAADLCAGSGSFGFEMISRGAMRVDFVENDRSRAALIRMHAEKFDVTGRYRIIIKDVAVFLQTCGERYAVIFYDPPYDAVHLERLVPAMLNLLSPGGVLLYQRRSHKDVDRRLEHEQPFEIKTFGDTTVEIHHASQE